MTTNLGGGAKMGKTPFFFSFRSPRRAEFFVFVNIHSLFLLSDFHVHFSSQIYSLFIENTEKIIALIFGLKHPFVEVNFPPTIASDEYWFFAGADMFTGDK